MKLPSRTESPAAGRSAWFSQARYGLFIHWGPYACLGRGEQVLFREHLDHQDYARMACAWNPASFDAGKWAALAVEAGMKYAVLTTRHHDGYCLWDSRLTDYTSVAQAPRRDFVREYVEAFRAAGLRVGFYYSLADWRIPAYWDGPQFDPGGWERFRDYVHGQVRELLTGYGRIDLLWFDGPWPRTATEWKSGELIEKIRCWQPDILINNRLDAAAQSGQPEQAGASQELGDFGTPEHQIGAENGRPWESCQVTTWRLWGYARGEHYRTAAQLLDLLCECASQGGNLLLNVGPDPEGEIPLPAESALREVGTWLRFHGEAIYGTGRGDLTEFTTYGYQTRRGNILYLICRFWPRSPEVRLAGLRLPGAKAVLLGSSRSLNVIDADWGTLLSGLPAEASPLFPVIRIDCASAPQILAWAKNRLWSGDPRRMTSWSRIRGTSPWVDGQERGVRPVEAPV